MPVYLDVVVALNFLVDFLLLLGTSRLCGYPPAWGRAALAGGVGGLYGGVCLLPGFSFLGNPLWRIVSLLIMGGITFGFCKNALRLSVVFLLLSMALGGMALGLGSGGFWSLAASALGVCLLCFFGFRERIGSVSYVPVELSYGEQHMHIIALQDTGNTLRDPITGKPVLVVCGEVAKKLTGLTAEQLESPLKTLTQGAIPGLQLIPYHAVGQPGGMLLALRIPKVKIGKWQGSSLVAFAPEELSREGAYKALTGGVL